MTSLFGQIAIVVSLAAGLGLVVHLFKQPTLLGYLIAGLIIGPLGYLHFNHAEVLDVMAEIGITLLLFMVGLEMNLTELKNIGKPALYTGVGQIVFTTLVGFALVTLLGFGAVQAFFISAALTFSSTIVVVKLLSEKNDLESLYGKIVVGFLIVQDVVAILMMVVISGLAGNSGAHTVGQLMITLGKGVAVVVAVFLIGARLLPALLDRIGRSSELLFVFSLAWGLGFAALMATDAVGYSLEMGGLLAGLALANSAEHFQIAGRIRPLRDFFILMFFVVLGSKMVLVDLSSIIVPGLILSVFVLIGNPIIVLIIMSFLGYKPRTSFLSSLAVAQVSEFSLIVMILGERLGFVATEHVSLVTMVAVITIVLSTYMIYNGNQLYHFLRKYLKIFGFRGGVAENIGAVQELDKHVVLVGAHRTGSSILGALKESGEKYVVVDFNPLVVQRLSEKKHPVIYGDVLDGEIQERAALAKARMVISTIPDMHDASSLLDFLRKNNPTAKVIMTAENDWEGLQLYKDGADYVLLPHFLGGQQLASILRTDHDFKALHQLKLRDMRMIKEDVI